MLYKLANLDIDSETMNILRLKFMIYLLHEIYPILEEYKEKINTKHNIIECSAVDIDDNAYNINFNLSILLNKKYPVPTNQDEANYYLDMIKSNLFDFKTIFAQIIKFNKEMYKNYFLKNNQDILDFLKKANETALEELGQMLKKYDNIEEEIHKKIQEKLREAQEQDWRPTETIPEDYYAASHIHNDLLKQGKLLLTNSIKYSLSNKLIKIAKAIIIKAKRQIIDVDVKGEPDEEKNKQKDLSNNPDEHYFYNESPPIGSFYNGTFVLNEEQDDTKHKMQQSYDQYAYPTYEEDEPKINEEDINEEQRHQIPKSKYKQLIEDLGDEKKDNHDVEAAKRHLLNDCIYKDCSIFIHDLSIISKKYFTFDVEPAKSISWFIEQNHFLESYKTINEYKEFFERLKVFDEIIGVYESTIGSKFIKEALIKIRELNENMMERLIENFEIYNNPDKMADFIAKKEEEDYTRQIQQIIKPEDLELDWRPTETIPEDYYAL